MSNLLNQKKLAAKVFECGLDRVWMDPESSDEISSAITRDDIRELIEKRTIKLKPVKGNSRGRARILAAKRKYGHRKGPGSRKGSKGARTNSKEQWMKKIRAQRKLLKECRENGTLDKTVYCKFYRKAKGGEFRSVAHLQAHIDALKK